MRRVGWVKYPGAALGIQVIFYIVEAWISPDHLQLTMAAMKFVPQSKRICFAGPLIAKNLLKALLKLLELMASIISM